MRKRIALLTINPEDESGRRIVDGIFEQCAACDMDVVMVTPMVHISHYYKDYLDGELKIYDIINFDLFDGVIIMPIPMREEQRTFLTDALLARFKAECKVPVVSIGEEFGDYPVVYGEEFDVMREVTEHMVNVHGVKDFAVLTGPENYHISEKRVEGVREVLESHGLTLAPDRVFYGDFWYSSGEQLGEKIVSGAITRPEAVLCASDHMAIGLLNYLTENGVRVPEDIMITGNGSFRVSYLALPPVTTYEPYEGAMGTAAVKKLCELMHESGADRATDNTLTASVLGSAAVRTSAAAHDSTSISSDGKITGMVPARVGKLCLGGTCGCREDLVQLRKKLRDYMYTDSHVSVNDRAEDGISLTTLLESYISERYSAVKNVELCLRLIYESTYLLVPYHNFYLCLNENWLQIDDSEGVGEYADKMNLVVYADQPRKSHGYDYHVFFGNDRDITFNTDMMLPALTEENDKPQVYYFVPVHISNKPLGYAVLQNDLDSKVRIGNVYRNYIRYICNALEMSRTKHHIREISDRDQLTGLYNRRGIDNVIGERLKDALNWMENGEMPEQYYLAVMIDMNHLKLINDSMGHEAGDAGITMIANAVKATCQGTEIAVRAGGDEFYIIGIGSYTEEDGMARVEAFKQNLQLLNDESGSETKYSAAAGFAIMKVRECQDIKEVLEQADIAMYVDKRKGRR